MTSSAEHVQQEGIKWGTPQPHTCTQQECCADLLRDNGSRGDDGFISLSINSPSVSMEEIGGRRGTGWTDGKGLEEKPEEEGGNKVIEKK